jgi:hypothetical protein
MGFIRVTYIFYDYSYVHVSGSNDYSKHFIRGSKPLERMLKIYMGPTLIPGKC